MSILLLGGSPSHPSSSSRLLLHIGAQLALQGHDYDTLFVRDLPAQALLHADFGDPAVRQAQALVAAADAVVIATPVYKASCSGILKAFLDLLPQDGLAGKLVLPVATGGSQSHMLALDYALRPILSALDARHVLTSIYATSEQLVLDVDGSLTLHPAIAARVGAGVAHLAELLQVLADKRQPGAAALRLAAGPTRSLHDYPYAHNSQAAPA